MKAIHCITSPQLDSHHLSEWAEHHLSFGFDKVFLFDLGPPMYDDVPYWLDSNDGPRLKWGKRKNRQFNEEKWASFRHGFKSFVEIIPTNHNKRGRRDFFLLQDSLINKWLSEYKRLGIKWIANIDTDELICGDISVLDKCESVSRFELRQRIFSNIRENESFRATKNMGQLNEVITNECCKNIVDPSSVLSWDNVHYGVKLKPNCRSEVNNSLYIEHHCGRKHLVAPIK